MGSQNVLRSDLLKILCHDCFHHLYDCRLFPHLVFCVAVALSHSHLIIYVDYLSFFPSFLTSFSFSTQFIGMELNRLFICFKVFIFLLFFDLFCLCLIFTFCFLIIFIQSSFFLKILHPHSCFTFDSFLHWFWHFLHLCCLFITVTLTTWIHCWL